MDLSTTQNRRRSGHVDHRGEEMRTYVFEKPLIRGMMLKRKSQFTAVVDIDGEELIAHIPTTNRIGDVENKNLPCLLSYHDDPKRKLKYDIEAVLLSDDENWVGINQILSNKLVEYFFNEHELDEIVSDFDRVQREVNLGISKLSFCRFSSIVLQRKRNG